MIYIAPNHLAADILAVGPACPFPEATSQGRPPGRRPWQCRADRQLSGGRWAAGVSHLGQRIAQFLPYGGEAGGGRVGAANHARRRRFARIARAGLAGHVVLARLGARVHGLEGVLPGRHQHRIDDDEGERLVRDLERHLPAAGLLRRFVGGAGDVRGTQQLPRLVELDAEARQRSRRGRVGIGQGGQQQVVRTDRGAARQPGGLRQRRVGGRGGADLALVPRAPMPRPDPAQQRAGGRREPALLALAGRDTVEHRRAEREQVAVLAHDLHRDPLVLPDQAEQQVLGADVVVMQLQGLAQRQLEHLLGPGRERDVPGLGLALANADLGDDLFADAFPGHPELFEDGGRDSVLVSREAIGAVEQREQDVLGADVVVVEFARLFLGRHDGAARICSESLEHAISLPGAFNLVNTMLLIGLTPQDRGGAMDWEDWLDEWETELELSAQLDGSEWVTLEKAAAETGVSRAALRTWYRAGQIPSRLVDGPHGPQRLVPLTVVAERAEASPRLRKTTERRLSDEAQLEILRHRIDQLELRLADLERRLG